MTKLIHRSRDFLVSDFLVMALKGGAMGPLVISQPLIFNSNDSLASYKVLLPDPYEIAPSVKDFGSRNPWYWLKKAHSLAEDSKTPPKSKAGILRSA